MAHLLFLLFLSLGAVLWGATLILGVNGTSFEQYLLLLGFFGLASAIFIFLRIRNNSIGIFYLPVFLTMLMFLRFGLVPIACFLDPGSLSSDFAGHYRFLLRALAYVFIGMLAFWVGCSLVIRKAGTGKPLAALPSTAQAPAVRSTLAWAAAIYAVVFAIRLYLLHSHLYAYVGSWKAYYANLGLLQVLATASSLGGVAALILVVIEKYFHPSDPSARLLFWVILTLEVGWGMASGMKEFVLQPIVIVAVISSLVQRKFPKGWVAVALLGLIAIYPLTNNYRRLALRRGGFASASAVASASLAALSETGRGRQGYSDWIQNGWQMTVHRLDLLTSFGLVLWMGSRAAHLQGKERWWMVPYYPFVPRFLWHSKPILDKGRRFSVATGSTSVSSLAITYPGDLYATGGLPGILLGMFLLGTVAQTMANSIIGALDKRRLFVYAALFFTVTDMEIDYFSFWTTLIKSFVMLSIIALVVYGPGRRAEQEVIASDWRDHACSDSCH